MTTATITQLHTAAMQDLNRLYNDLQRPYGQGEIVRFNLAYQRLYPQLNPSEKQRAEKLVDSLLDNLEDDRLASKVYGVV